MDRNGVTPCSPKSARKNHKHKDQLDPESENSVSPRQEKKSPFSLPKFGGGSKTVLDIEGVSEKLQDTPKSERKKLQKQKTGDSSRTTVRKTYKPRMNSLQNARCKFR
ncbi:PREDICTED: uncharacterized protein LOC107343978 [Acropora digitifera]|uniref:uncharacterized protein LOC107343978 n=1 Tax=Acropora digitifera TaxID=70779 RepID=UPI00077A4623|nr:PREDICTED: uncharacterized protein LOC107343978 [Acropora digitifera]